MLVVFISPLIGEIEFDEDFFVVPSRRTHVEVVFSIPLKGFFIVALENGDKLLGIDSLDIKINFRSNHVF